MRHHHLLNQNIEHLTHVRSAPTTPTASKFVVCEVDSTVQNPIR